MRGVPPSARCTPIATRIGSRRSCHTGTDQHAWDAAGRRETASLP